MLKLRRIWYFMLLKLRRIWYFMLALVIISFTEVGRKIVISINSTVGILFCGYTIRIEVIKTIYRYFFICFFICSFVLALPILWDVWKNQRNKKSEFIERISKGTSIRNLSRLSITVVSEIYG